MAAAILDAIGGTSAPRMSGSRIAVPRTAQAVSGSIFAAITTEFRRASEDVREDGANRLLTQIPHRLFRLDPLPSQHRTSSEAERLRSNTACKRLT